MLWIVTKLFNDSINIYKKSNSSEYDGSRYHIIIATIFFFCLDLSLIIGVPHSLRICRWLLILQVILRLLYFFLTTCRQAWKAWIRFNLSATKQSKSFLISRFVHANLFLMEVVLRASKYFFEIFLTQFSSNWKKLLKV